MSQIEVIQYEGESPREKRKGEDPARENKSILVWRFFEQIYNPPTHDPDTQRLALTGYQINGDNWEAQYAVTDLSPEEIALKEQQAYLSSLNWDALESQLIDISEGTPYRQLSEWAGSDPKFADCKTNLAFALNRRNEVFLQQALGDIKQKTMIFPQFTSAQLTEIDNCLETLGVNWRWAQL